MKIYLAAADTMSEDIIRLLPVAKRLHWNLFSYYYLLTLKKMEEKTKTIDLLNQQKKVDAEKRKKRSDTILSKKKKLMEEFNRLLESGGEPDIEKLAKQFDLDLDELNRKVYEGDRKNRSTSSMSTNNPVNNS